MSLTIVIQDADAIYPLNSAKVGDTLTITALVNRVEQEVIDITEFGMAQPKHTLGATTVELVIQDIR